MSFTIFWVPLQAASEVGEALPQYVGLSLPYMVDERAVDTTGGGIRATLELPGLARGILMGGVTPRHAIATGLSSRQLQDVLRVLQQGFRLPSLDAACAAFAGQIRKQYGLEAGVQALRTSVGLVQGCTLCRGDLIVALLETSATPTGESIKVLEETVQHYADWGMRDTSMSGNEAVVHGCGLAAMMFLGSEGAVGTKFLALSEAMPGWDWLTARRAAIQRIRRGNWDDLRFLHEELAAALAAEARTAQ